MRRSISIPFFALMAFCAVPIHGQSVSAADGLGAPLESLDARSRALGGVGIGLPGNRLVPTDPAAMADLNIPSLSFSLQTAWVDVDESGNGSTITGTRFPLLGVAYPLGRLGVASLSFGTSFDQEWSVARSSTIDLGGTGSQARVTDEFSSEGGVATLRLGYSKRLGPAFLAIGATLGTYTGDVSRVFTRSFDSIDADAAVPNFNVGGQWRYSGMNWSVGAAGDISEVVRVAASYSHGGSLKATPTDDTDGGPAEIPMANQLRIGGSALLAPELALTAGYLREDWSETGASYDDVTGYTTDTWGSGIEFTGTDLLGKPGAIRLGYRSGGLPFAPDGAEKPTEKIFSGGIGLDLLLSGNLVVTSSDFTLERGSRTVGAISEEFWRFALSARISGF